MNALLAKTNSVTDSFYLSSQESSSSIYPGVEPNPLYSYIERNLRQELREVYVKNLFRSLVLASESDSIDYDLDLDTRLNAVIWLIKLRRIAQLRGYWWQEPLVNFSEDEVVFEWWHGQRKVTVYISGGSAEYVRIWGPNIDQDMEDGVANTSATIEKLWQWIAS